MANDLNRSIKIYLDHSSAMESANQLKTRIGELESKFKQLQTTGQGNTVQAKKLTKELDAQTAKYESYKQKVSETNRVLKNLSGATYNELIQSKKAVEAQLKKTERGTDMYNNRLRVHKALTKEITIAQQEMRSEVSTQSSIWNRAADGINKYAGIAAGIIATITGVTFALNKMREERDRLEDTEADVKALTGLDDESVTWLTNQAKKLSTQMTEEKVRIRSGAEDILEAYKVVGGAKADLLENKEALAEVTKQTLILATASKMDMKEAAEATILSMNQYGAAAEEASRYVNTLAAGSSAGAAEVDNIVKSVVKAGVSAASANIPIEQLVGSIETLAERGIKDEIAGTGLKRFFLTLQTGADETNPKVVGLIQALETLKEKNLDAGQMKDMFGEQGFNVASVMINSIEKVKELTAAVTDTNIAVQQAQIVSDTAAAKRAQAINQLKLMGIELIEQLNPSILKVMNSTVNWTRTFIDVVGWGQKNSKMLLVLISTLALYTAAIKLNSYWKTISHGESMKIVIAEKAAIIVRKARIANIYAMIAGKRLLAGNIRLATVAMRGFLVTLGLNPITAFAVALGALSVGIYKVWDSATKTSRAIRAMNKEIANEQAEAYALFDALNKSNAGSQRRKDLIEEINSKYGSYLDNLLTEKTTTDDIAIALNTINKKIRENIALKAMQKDKEEILSDSLETQRKAMDQMRESSGKIGAFLTDSMLSDVKRITEEGQKYGKKWQKTYSDITAYIDRHYNAREKMDKGFWTSMSNYVEDVYLMSEKLDRVTKSYSPFTSNSKSESDTSSSNQLPEVAITGISVSSDKDTATDKATFKQKYDLRLKEMANAHAEEMALLKKNKLETEETDEVFNIKALVSDQEYFKKRLSVLNEFLSKAKTAKDRADVKKDIVDTEISLLDLEVKKDKETLNSLQLIRDKKLQIEEENYTKSKTAYELAMAEGILTEERYKALMLTADADASEKRLEIHQEYLSDVNSLEINSGSIKIKEIENANKAVLDADLKSAQARATQQKALQNLLKDFKSEFKLTTVGEDTEFQLKALEASYQARKEMAEKANMDTTELDKAYALAKTNIMEESENRINNIRKQYGLLSMQDEYAMELELLEQQRAQELISEENYQSAKTNIRIKYLKKSFDYYKNLFSGAIDALQEAELANIDAKYDVEIERAQGNSDEVARLESEKEQKKLDVQKKYAGVQFAVKVSEIVANTAVAIMQAYAQLGPIAGTVAAALMGVTGAAQIAIANAERKKIMNMSVSGSSSSSSNSGKRVVTGGGFSEGGYTGNGGVLEVAGNVHKKEYVVPAWEMQEPAAMNHVLALEAIRRERTSANPLPASVSGYAEGGYTGDTSSDLRLDKEMLAVLKELNIILSYLKNNPLKAFIVLSELQAKIDIKDKSKKIGSK